LWPGGGDRPFGRAAQGILLLVNPQRAELDLLVVRGRRRLGFEFKYSDAPKITRSMHIALADLKLDSLDMVHAGQHTFPLAEKVRALSLSRITTDLAPL
jgi:hypothetical protein